MIITKKALPRRTILRGIGTALALPLMDGMVPALTALSRTAAQATQRLGVVYVPNGIVMKSWTPSASGGPFEFTPILEPLKPFRDRLVVLSGLTNEGENSHETGSTKFLTGMPAKRTQGSDLRAGVSMDQIAANTFGQQTQLASLELALDPPEVGGTCGTGYSCAYTNTISWRGPTTPLPMEFNPRAVFERLLGDSASTDPQARLARIKDDRSILDAVNRKIHRLRTELGARDRTKLDEYLEAVRDVERRIQRAEEQSGRELPRMERPTGVPATFEQHAKLMFDLQVLAYQCDLTRVITFMMGREFSGRTYGEIGVPDAHHPTSHHQNDPSRLDKLVRISTYHTTLLAYYLDKLRSTADGEGSLLDNVAIIYGAGLSDSNAHSAKNLPIVVIGGAGGTLTGGRHLRHPEQTPMANLHVSLLNQIGVPVERLGNSDGQITL